MRNWIILIVAVALIIIGFCIPDKTFSIIVTLSGTGLLIALISSFLMCSTGMLLFLVGLMLMVLAFSLAMGNFSYEAMRDQLTESAWQQHLLHRDRIWWASGICAVVGVVMFAISFKLDWGGPE